MDGSELFFGNYRVLEPLGRGGFGQVYRGEHRFLTRRVVAIKIMRDAPLHTDKEREAFLREAEILEQLKHRFILPIFDVGIQENEAYLITEYAPNGSLKQRLRALGNQLLPLEEALSILSQIAEALQFAHENKVIHRDLKPDNILFNAQNEALLADFGIATLLHTASFHQTKIIGTPMYMAPEQFRGEVAAESDQYALACLAYELLTRRTPFSAPDFISLGFKHFNENPQPPSQLNPNLPEHIDAAIIKALAKVRTERYTNVQTFISALQALPNSPNILPVRGLPNRESTQPASPNVDNLLAKAEALREQEHYQDALEICDRAIQLDPNSVETYRKKGYVLGKLGRHQDALAAFELAIQLNPTLAVVYHDKGAVLYKLGRHQDALNALDQAIRLDPILSTAYAEKGFVLYELGRHQDALTAFDQATQLDPALTVAHHDKGFVLNKLGRYQDALIAFDQATRLDPDLATAYAAKGFALDKLGRSREARKAYAKARKLGWDG